MLFRLKTCLSLAAVLTATLCRPACATDTLLHDARVATYFSPNGGAAGAVVQVIDAARERVLLAGYLLTSTTIARALQAAHQRGVAVRLVLDPQNLVMPNSAAKRLASAGIEVVTDPSYAIMHQKFLVADDVVGFGSMNFTYSGDRKNAENFNLFFSAPALAALYEREFERLRIESQAFPVEPAPAAAIALPAIT
ncbi:MAG: phospholipase D family protein [Janthinobacterium lividum]